jgi:hypothetical protein
MTEDFALIFSEGDDVEEDGNGYSPAWVDHVRWELAELDSPERISVTRGSVGYGADGFVVFAVLTGLSGLFFLGKQIDENIDAWVRLGGKLKSVIKRLRVRRGRILVSEPAALALALDNIAGRHEAGRITEIVASHRFPVLNASLGESFRDNFANQPDRFYLFILRTELNDIFVAGIRSSGELEFAQRLPTGNWQEYYGVVGPGGRILGSGETVD